ncbi:MAG TPA: ATP-binding protein [Methylocystis sp.]|nr:ATP-binding protein [Methylocystis sp.]
MRRSQTIGLRLTAAFIFLFFILIGFGVAGLLRVDDFNRDASAIRERWLRSTRFLGDLNNYTSDFRAMEATFLLTPDAAELATLETESAGLDGAIRQAQRAYEEVASDRAELDLYKQFQKTWLEYRAEADQVFAAVRAGRNAPGVKIYFSSSRRSFAAASELLDRLNDLNNVDAQKASARAAAAIGAAWSFFSAAVILSALTVVAILLYVLRTVIYPLKELAQCMHALAEGDMDPRIPAVEAENELREMARAVSVFRNNAVELKLSQRGLASQATMLEEKLAHEIRLNEQQRNFISMASHEFRTPMTIIDGHAQRLLNAPEPDAGAKTAERAKKIRTAVRRMGVMLDNILKSAQLLNEDPASLYLHLSHFDLRAILHEVCKLHREISPNHIILENLGREPAFVVGDKDLLFQVFNNLVGNSVKYSRRGGMIRVDCEIGDEAVTVSVKDEGMGIPQRDIPHVFTRYYRAGNAKSVSGAGIGLFFVKIVVGLHDGSIRVDSREGAGSTFFITLPRKKPAPLEAPAP